MFSFFFKNLHTVLYSGCTNLHSHKKCRQIPFSSHSLHHLLFVDFFDDGHSDCVRWYLIEVLTCISLVINDVDHLFLCFLAISMSSLKKCLFRLFAHFLIELFIFLTWSCMSCLYLLEIYPCWSLHLQISYTILWVVFLFCLWFPCWADDFKFN